jgi:RimJ/RimL family protein N-acetyltransferase
VLAKDAWGLGYATEVLQAMVALAPALGVRRLYALCHPEHLASQRVLEKCGFDSQSLLRCHSEFQNMKPGEPYGEQVMTRLNREEQIISSDMGSTSP